MKKRNLKKTKNLVNNQISSKLAKFIFVTLMVLIFLSLSFKGSSSLNLVTTYSILDTVNPGTNFAIFFGLLALVFFLTYENKKSKK